MTLMLCLARHHTRKVGDRGIGPSADAQGVYQGREFWWTRATTWLLTLPCMVPQHSWLRTTSAEKRARSGRVADCLWGGRLPSKSPLGHSPFLRGGDLARFHTILPGRSQPTEPQSPMLPPWCRDHSLGPLPACVAPLRAIAKRDAIDRNVRMIAQCFSSATPPTCSRLDHHHHAPPP